MTGYVWLWLAMAGYCWLQPAIANHCWPLLAMAGHHQVEALKLTFIMYERAEGN